MTELETVERQITEVNSKVTSILHLLSGNELDPSTGLVHKVKEQSAEIGNLKSRVVKLEKLKERIIYVAIGLALPTTYGAASLISKFINSITGK